MDEMFFRENDALFLPFYVHADVASADPTNTTVVFTHFLQEFFQLCAFLHLLAIRKSFPYTIPRFPTPT